MTFSVEPHESFKPEYNKNMYLLILNWENTGMFILREAWTHSLEIMVRSANKAWKSIQTHEYTSTRVDWNK